MSEKETDAEKLVKLLIENMQKNIHQKDEWELETKTPFESKVIEESKVRNYVTTINPEPKETKKLLGFPTMTFLDTIFLDSNDKPINGIPFGSNCILTGLPNSGKSLLEEEIALLTSNSGKKVCYVPTEEVFKTETSRFDLESRLREKAKILGLDWKRISDNLLVLDTVTHAELREWNVFVETYRYLVENNGIDLLLVDSLTLLEESRGMIKARLLELMKYNQNHGVTSIFVSQRAIEETDSFALAGGLSLSHIADIVLELDYKRLSSWDSTIKLDTNGKQGETINFFRILKCRMCRFKGNYFQYEINKDGLVRLLQKAQQSP